MVNSNLKANDSTRCGMELGESTENIPIHITDKFSFSQKLIGLNRSTVNPPVSSR